LNGGIETQTVRTRGQDAKVAPAAQAKDEKGYEFPLPGKKLRHIGTLKEPDSSGSFE
jgi:hypothetical protein